MMLEYILVILLLVYDSHSIFKSELLRNLEQNGRGTIIYRLYIFCVVWGGSWHETMASRDSSF